MIDNDSFVDPAPHGDLPDTVEKMRDNTQMLGISTVAFAKAISKAFTDATAGGKQFDDVLKQLALRLSNLAVMQGLNPAAKGLANGLSKLFSNLFGETSDPSDVVGARSITPFAAGGVIASPAYFPLPSGGVGLAGEAGPEAIVPLTRGSDGRLGIAMNGGNAQPNITVQIATPDVHSFRRSEAYITGQIARAVARGQRGF
jgi:phage-related minor tail protein